MEKLGVELPLLITQVINFVIMIFILTKFLYKPILKALEERRAKIEAGLKLTEKLKTDEEKLQKRKDEILAETREEARTLIEEAKNQGKIQKDDIIAQGKKESEIFRSKTEKELENKFSQMEETLQRQTVSVASEMIKRLLPDLLKDEDHHKLIAQQFKLMQKHHAK